MDFLIALKLIVLLVAANGAPILASYLLRSRWNHPLDAHRSFSDGQPLLGPSKTWRGLLAAILATPVVAWLLFLPPGVGVSVAIMAMVGDLLSSFIKRRLQIAPSGRALGLDQIPESLLPLVALRGQFALDAVEILLLGLAFMALELVLSRILYSLHIRKQPY